MPPEIPILPDARSAHAGRARLIAVTGPPCSGKSTVATRLAQLETGVTIDIDEIRAFVLPDSKQTQADRNIAYRCMHLIALKLVQAGVTPVVLVATYARREVREALGALAANTKSALFVIECRIEPDVAVSRFRRREPGHPAIDLTDERVQALAREYPYGSSLVLETTEPADISVTKARQHLLQGHTIDASAWILKGQCGSPVSSRA